MSTLLQLVNDVLRKAGQQEATTVANAAAPIKQAVDFINQTRMDMFHTLETHRLIATHTVTVTAAQDTYTLSGEVSISSILPDSLYVAGQSAPLREVDYRHGVFRDAISTGTPRYFFRQGEAITLRPVPDADTSVQLQYLKVPEALTADVDTIDLPTNWEPTLVMGALALLEKFLGDGDYVQTYALYREQWAQLRAKSSKSVRPQMKSPYPYKRGGGHFGGGSPGSTSI